MTSERLARINQLLDQRQADLTLCLESVHKNHNLSALIRSADAVGIHEVHAIWYGPRLRVRAGAAVGTNKWVKVHNHDGLPSAIEQLKAEKKQIIVTNLSPQAVDFRAIDYTKPTAIILGQERRGVTPEAIAAADHQVIVPMVGMAESLNVSVAAAVILYEAQRQRAAVGRYQQPSLPQAERQRVLFEGGHPIFARLCRLNDIPYPAVGEQGEILADEQWWQRIRSANR